MTLESILQKILEAVFQNGEYLWRSSPAVLVLLPVYFFTHPEKVSVWSGLVAALFEKISSRSARHGVSSDIQSKLEAYIKNNNSQEILPYGLKFRWIKDEKTSSYIDENDTRT